MNYFSRLIYGIILLISVSSPIESNELPIVNPNQVGIDAERLSRADRYIHRIIDQRELAGVVVMAVRDGKVFHYKHYGKRDIDNNLPMKKDTIFRIYSMTKPITSVAVMMLMEEGHFLLSDPISRFLPEFKDIKVYKSGDKDDYETIAPNRQITIHDLLTHTSGMVYGFGDSIPDQIASDYGIWGKKIKSLKETVKQTASVPLLYQPGERWNYSLATEVLGRLVEVVSGKSLDQFLMKRIFQPLDMNDTSFQTTKDSEIRLAELYKFNDGRLFQNHDDFYRLQFNAAGAGLLSTARDYLHFAQMMLNKGELFGNQILSRKSVELMTTNHLSPSMLKHNNGDGFGLGFHVRVNLGNESILGSQGEHYWSGAASTTFRIDPRENLVCVFLTQRTPYTDQYSSTYMNLVYQALD